MYKMKCFCIQKIFKRTNFRYGKYNYNLNKKYCFYDISKLFKNINFSFQLIKVVFKFYLKEIFFVVS